MINVVGALGTIPEKLGERLEEWKIKEESKPSRLPHCYDRLGYSEESWRHEETCCHLDSSEKRTTDASVKN